jgi:hypothetical protein
MPNMKPTTTWICSWLSCRYIPCTQLAYWLGHVPQMICPLGSDINNFFLEHMTSTIWALVLARLTSYGSWVLLCLYGSLSFYFPIDYGLWILIMLLVVWRVKKVLRGKSKARTKDVGAEDDGSLQVCGVGDICPEAAKAIGDLTLPACWVQRQRFLAALRGRGRHPSLSPPILSRLVARSLIAADQQAGRL